MTAHRPIAFVLCASLTLGFVMPSFAWAAPNAEYLLSDVELENPDTMSLSEIQVFLDQHGGLGGRVVADVDGAFRTTAEIIWRVAHDYQLSPRFLLVLLQREQSLVESSNPSQRQMDWAVGYARCDACDPEHPLVAAYKGFGKQLEGAARRIRTFYLPDIDRTGRTQTGIGPGIATTIDGTLLTPFNKATAILYTYTPHLHGNLNFARIWKRWFSHEIPDGSLVHSLNDDAYWLIQHGKKRRFDNLVAYLSRHKPQDALALPADALVDYDEGTPIRFANYSVIRDPDANSFLVDGDTIRHITSPDVFRMIGFNPYEVEDVSTQDLAGFERGEPITSASQYPTGALLQDKTTGGVYFVKDGIKHPIWAKEIMDIRFPKKKIVRVTTAALNDIPSGEPLGFAEGALIGITGNPVVYVVSNGRRRAIQNEDAFHTLGWNFTKVIWTSEAVAAVHPVGEPFDIHLEQDPTVRSAGL